MRIKRPVRLRYIYAKVPVRERLIFSKRFDLRGGSISHFERKNQGTKIYVYTGLRPESLCSLEHTRINEIIERHLIKLLVEYGGAASTFSTIANDEQ